MMDSVRIKAVENACGTRGEEKVVCKNGVKESAWNHFVSAQMRKYEFSHLSETIVRNGIEAHEAHEEEKKRCF